MGVEEEQDNHIDHIARCSAQNLTAVIPSTYLHLLSSKLLRRYHVSLPVSPSTYCSQKKAEGLRAIRTTTKAFVGVESFAQRQDQR